MYFGLLFILVSSIVGTLYVSFVYMGWSWLDSIAALYFAGFFTGMYTLFYAWGPDGDERIGALGGMYNDDARFINALLTVFGYPALVLAVSLLIHDLYLAKSKKQVIKTIVFGAVYAILIVEFFVAFAHKDLIRILLFGGAMYIGTYSY